MKGKSYKRCKKTHELSVLDFEIFHFDSKREEVLRTILQEMKDLYRVEYQYLHTSIKEFDGLTEDYLLHVSATINWE